MKKTVKLALFAMLFLSATVIQPFNAARAVNEPDITRSATLTLLCPCDNAGASLFHVASIDDSGDLTVQAAFRRYNVEINSDSWKSLAQTLALYAQRDDITPTGSANSHTNGSIRFEGLECGLYLVTVEPVISDSEIVITQPVMVMLPTYDDLTSQWLYDVTVKPKYMKRSIFDSINIEVIKSWSDEGRDADRPREIEAELLRNGEVFQTVILSEENNWRHTWYGLEGSYDWSVTERVVPDGYTVIVSTESQTVVITNTASEDAPPNTQTPPGYNTPAPSLTPEPSGQPSAPPTPPPKLPQTGQLWWPVGVLTSCGLIMLFLGLIKKRNDGKKDKRI